MFVWIFPDHAMYEDGEVDFQTWARIKRELIKKFMDIVDQRKMEPEYIFIRYMRIQLKNQFPEIFPYGVFDDKYKVHNFLKTLKNAQCQSLWFICIGSSVIL